MLNGTDVMNSLFTFLAAQMRTCVQQVLNSGSLRIAALVLVGMVNSAQVQAQGILRVDSISDVNFGIWANAGNLSASQSTCVVSVSTTGSSWWGREELPYHVRVTSLEDSKKFYLYKNGNSSAKGNERIALDFIHTDLYGGGGTEELKPGKKDRNANSSSVLGCFLGIKNSNLQIDIGSGQLSGAANGYYTGNFEFEVENDFNLESVYFSVSVTVQGSSEVSISRLDNIDFGEYNGPGALQATERFCVYSANSAYSISISSANQDAAGNFYLSSNDTGQKIPMNVRFADSANGSAGNEVGRTALSGVGNSQSSTCQDSDNASITLSMAEQDLAATKSGFYSDTLVLLVQPE